MKDIKRPWALTFSFGRALQNSCVKTWSGKNSKFDFLINKGKEENVTKAQMAFLERAIANGKACVGKNFDLLRKECNRPIRS